MKRDSRGGTTNRDYSGHRKKNNLVELRATTVDFTLSGYRKHPGLTFPVRHISASTRARCKISPVTRASAQQDIYLPRRGKREPYPKVGTSCFYDSRGTVISGDADLYGLLSVLSRLL